jgi:NitT/TauT family transport system permease protein
MTAHSSTDREPLVAASDDVMEEAAVLRGARHDRQEPRADERRLRWHERRVVIVAVQALILASLVALWQVAANREWIDTFFWSSPRDVADAFHRLTSSGRLLDDTLFTMRSALLGFAAGTAAGAIVGLSLWWSRFAARVVEPLIIAFHAIPKLAITPLLVLFLGLGLSSKVVLVVMSTGVITALTAHAGVKAVDPDLVTMLQSLGATRAQIFRKVVMPSAAPWVVSALRLNIGLSITASVVGEMIGSRQGLGRMIYQGSALYEVDVVWVGVFTLAAIAIVMYVTVGALERVLLRGILHGADAPVRRR